MTPDRVAFFIPPQLTPTKVVLFERIGAAITARGGRVVRGDAGELDALAGDFVPIVTGTLLELRAPIARWRAQALDWIYWDRGYVRRGGATDLPPGGADGGFYRWQLNGFQMRAIRAVPSDRWAALATPVAPWRSAGRHIVVAVSPGTYEAFHGVEGWTKATKAALARVTDRPIVVRQKTSPRRLRDDLVGAHALVAHGSNAAVEAAIMGTPVFVGPDSAAAPIGLTDLAQIERPVTPDRAPWLASLAYSQFNRCEMLHGALWRLLEQEVPCPA